VQFLFEDHVLDVDRRELRRGAQQIPVGPQVFDLLVYLVQNRERVVTKDDLLDAVWSGRFVSESNLTTRINAARKAIGDTGEEQRLIRTVPRKGFRFVGVVTCEAENVKDVRGSTATTPKPLPLPDKPSIAVLPFVNMSGDPEQEYFADGIAEDIITALSRFPSLFVIARNSSFTYKGRTTDIRAVGRDLGVRYVLEGSLRKGGSRIRVTAQLIEGETSKHVWAERYDRDIADIFAIQDEISETVTVAIAPAIAAAERQRAMRKPPENLDAWAAYQRGLWHFDQVTVEGNRLAEQFFQKAIDLDPNFAGGYVGLAYVHTVAATAFGTADLKEATRSSERLARQAVALDPDNSDAHSCLSRSLFLRGDLEGSRAKAERALALCPNLASAYWRIGDVLLFSSKPKEALAAMETALRFDPRDTSMFLPSELLVLAIGRYFCQEYEAAVEALQRVLRSYPEFPNAYRWLAAALGELGHIGEARTALDRAIALAPASFEMYVQSPPPWFRPEDHAHMLEGLRKAGWQG
jgi:adenylate cyclase